MEMSQNDSHAARHAIAESTTGPSGAKPQDNRVDDVHIVHEISHSSQPPTEISSRMTVILTTSPTRQDPSVDMIAHVLHSFQRVTGLTRCPLIVITDGHVVKENVKGHGNIHASFRVGKVLESHVPRYATYKENLRQLLVSMSRASYLGYRTSLDLDTSKMPETPHETEGDLGACDGGDGVVVDNERTSSVKKEGTTRTQIADDKDTDNDNENDNNDADCRDEDGSVILRDCTLVELCSHHGFGLAVKAALKYVRTSHVMVVQHDRAFTQDFDICGVLDTIEKSQRKYSCVCGAGAGAGAGGAGADDNDVNDAAHIVAGVSNVETDAVNLPCIKVVSLLTPKLVNHASKVSGTRSAQKIYTKQDRGQAEISWKGFASRVVTPLRGIRLVPLLYWLDSTHITTTRHYKDFVFGGHRPGSCGVIIRRGGFIEDKLGQEQLRQLREEGPASHARHGTWILDNGHVLALHCDSGKFDPTMPINRLYDKHGVELVTEVPTEALPTAGLASAPASAPAPAAAM